ncbi:MAG: hypothetical protein ICV68_18165 [Pyrinomonadaceae bacterium]|nr:hypothetical protein [Pyrinomonadaceae bacterium]
MKAKEITRGEIYVPTQYKAAPGEQFVRIAEKPTLAVSNYGTILSLVAGKEKPRAMKALNTCGYPQVSLMLDGKQYTWPFFHIVAVLWVPNPDPATYTCVLHNDSDKLNSRADNLRWGTVKENVADSIDQGTHPSCYKKPVLCYLNGELIAEFPSSHHAARVFKINQGGVHANAVTNENGLRYKYKGYSFVFKNDRDQEAA